MTLTSRPKRACSRLRIVHSPLGASLAEAWGFPREITPEERESGIWFLYDRRGIGWLEPTQLPNVFGVHYAIDPAHRRRYLPIFRCLDAMSEMAFRMAGEPGMLIASEVSRGVPMRRMGFQQIAPDANVWIRPFGLQGRVSMGGDAGKIVGGLLTATGIDPITGLALFGGAADTLNPGDIPDPPGPQEEDEAAASAAEAERRRKAQTKTRLSDSPGSLASQAIAFQGTNLGGTA